MCIERQVIEFCSPTLARLKTGSLFSCKYDSAEALEEQLGLLNSLLNKKDVYLCVLRRKDGRALIYVYRKKRLFKELQKKEVSEFLERRGYSLRDTDDAVERLNRHFAEHEDFPHEIGVFLGYPICDVIGFIANKGKNSKYTGCWKVYGDVKEAERTFNKFKKCTDVYVRLWNGGRSINRLTVSA